MGNFRKRRLSLPRHHVSEDSPESESPSPVKGKDQTSLAGDQVLPSPPPKEDMGFRKRRLSLTLTTALDTEEPASNRQKRSASVTSTASNSSGKMVATRTLHSEELLGAAPLSGSSTHDTNHVLYKQSTQPPPVSIMQLAASTTLHWRRWQTTIHDDLNLPFPRELVGTYSCHGVEPIYDAEEDEDEDDFQLHLSAESDDEPSQPDAEKAVIKAKINQDRGGVAFPYGNSPKTALFAVYDGHGQGGELVSQFCLYEMQHRLEKHKLFVSDLPGALRETFIEIDNSLTMEQPLIQPAFAGTTACVVLLRGNLLTIANVGDSRAVVARRKPSDEEDSIAAWDTKDLTIDQNPDLPNEHARIVASGGFVSPPPGPGLSARVWLDPRCTQIGLAMARSIGDHAVASVGVIADPVISTHEVVANVDDFMVIASDGVWEFISSEQAVDIVGQYLEKGDDEGGATRACRALIEAAAARWHAEEGEYRDDITAVVVHLSKLWG